MFVALGAILGIAEDPSIESILWNITYLGPIKEGILTLYTGRQTIGLVAGKKLDAIARSMPSIVLQLFALLLDLNNFNRTTYVTLVVSIGFGLLGSSATLSGLHPKAGHQLVSKQFIVIFFYYTSELVLRSMLLAVMFHAIRAYAFIVVGLDFLFRCWVVRDVYKKIDLSSSCLYMGSDNAIEGGRSINCWVSGSFSNYLFMIIFVIVMFTLDTDDLHVLREEGTALHVTITMLLAGIFKHFLYYFIKDMEAPKEDSNLAADDAGDANMIIELANALV